MGNDPEKIQKYRVVGWLTASACAEFIADIFLCPMESVKVRVQTD
jgi:solute carrier family 25 phosphate transporter 3